MILTGRNSEGGANPCKFTWDVWSKDLFFGYVSVTCGCYCSISGVELLGEKVAFAWCVRGQRRQHELGYTFNT